MRGAPRAAAAPVAKQSSVSDVEVSPSIVTALKLSVTPRASSDCSTGAAIGASVNTNDSMVAMSGAIMPAPLAMPQIVTSALPIRAVAVAPLGNVSVVMIALGGVLPAAGRRAGHQAFHHAVERLGLERLADHAGRGEEDVARLAADRLGGEVRREGRGVASGLAGERVGVAGIDHQRPRLAGLEPGAAPVDRRGRAFRAGQHARDGGAGVEQRQQDVGAARIADAGRRGGEAHAGDRRHVGKARGRERRNGGWPWGSSFKNDQGRRRAKRRRASTPSARP